MGSLLRGAGLRGLRANAGSGEGTAGAGQWQQALRPLQVRTEQGETSPQAAQPSREACWPHWPPCQCPSQGRATVSVPQDLGVDTHACTCTWAGGPRRSQRSPPGSAHSGRLSCCAGSAGSGQSAGRSYQWRSGPRSHCTGTCGRAGGARRAPGGPHKSHHHRSHSAALRVGWGWGDNHEAHKSTMGSEAQGASLQAPSQGSMLVSASVMSWLGCVPGPLLVG